MRNNITLYLLIVLLFYSCLDRTFDEHYARPDWLKGNAWTVLEERNDFSLFLKAVERAGFKELVEGKGIVTIMAPNDEAFKNYLQKREISSIESLPLSELRKIVGYHLVYYSFGREKFANYQPEGVDFANPSFVGLYYKHRTKSRDTISVVTDWVDNKEKKVFHKERFLPVLSSNLFNTKGINARYNYEYFYPQSDWNGDGGNYNVSNASVKEYAIPTDNGYIYIIDEVLEPLETVHQELHKEPSYATFINLYDKFADYWYDDATSRNYASLGDSLYIMRHTSLPQIASEWSYNGEGGLPDFANLPALSSEAFNVFAPDNQALEGFFNDFWSDHYSAIDEVDLLPISYLLQNHVYKGDLGLIFPEEIAKDKVKTDFGSTISFNPDQDVRHKKICVNGAYYGLSTVAVPDMFKSVVSPLLQNPSYKIFLYMVERTNLIQPLASDALNYTLFIPSDDNILEVIYNNSNIFWSEGHPLKYGDELIEVEDSNGNRVPMSIGSMTTFVNNHVVPDEVITSIGGKSVYRTRNPFSYLYVTNAGVASSSLYNIGQFADPDEINTHIELINGKVYKANAALINEPGDFKSLIITASTAGSPLQEFSEFSTLLAQAGLTSLTNSLPFLFGDKFLVFAPTNQAIIDAKGQGLVPSNAEALAEWLKYYFVPVSDNSLNDFPFPGFGIGGDLLTSQRVGGTSKSLTLTDMGASLMVGNGNGTSANVVGEFPRIYADGAAYLIDKVLQPE